MPRCFEEGETFAATRNRTAAPWGGVRVADNRKLFRRIDHPGDAHYLTWSCYRRIPFFKNQRCCEWLAEAIVRVARGQRWIVWGYVFMPDHVHLLVLPTTVEPGFSVSDAAKSIKQSVSRRTVNWIADNQPESLSRMLDVQPNGKSVHRLWERGPGYDENITDPLAIHNILVYIHNNPIRKQLVERPEDSRWSSALAWATRIQGDIPIDFDSFPMLVSC
jgi:putative transposase